METDIDNKTQLTGISPDILEEIQKGKKLKVETVILKSSNDVFVTLLALDVDFVLVLNTLNPVHTIEDIVSFIEKEKQPVTLLAFSFLEA